MEQNGLLSAVLPNPRILLGCFAIAVFDTGAAPLKARSQPEAVRGPATEWPVPAEPLQLFYLQRDPDINTVVYQLNMVDGEINEDQPVNVFWIRYAENNEQKPLNYVQRTMAFGLTHKKLVNGDFALQLVSYKDLSLRLSYHPSMRRHVVYARINETQAILDRIYVRIDGGSTFNPNILYFELSGRDTSTGRSVSERVTP